MYHVSPSSLQERLRNAPGARSIALAFARAEQGHTPGERLLGSRVGHVIFGPLVVEGIVFERKLWCPTKM